MSEIAESHVDQILGVTICSNCQKRFRIPKKHEGLIGKSIRCPQCREQFVVQLEVPTQVEQAAIENAEQESDQKARQKRTRRTKSQIRDEHLTTIRDALNTFYKRLAAIYDQNGTEEQVRIWCVDVLRSALNYEDCDINTEVTALGQRIDIALMDGEKIFLIIECKRPSVKLRSSVREQAVMYAVNKSSDWAVVTNGAIWTLYNVKPEKGRDPSVVEVFSVGLMDEDGISDADVANFYLLTKRALFNGETKTAFLRKAAASDQQILKAMTSERVINAVTKELIDTYQRHHDEKVAFPNDFVADRLSEMFLPDELSK